MIGVRLKLVFMPMLLRYGHYKAISRWRYQDGILIGELTAPIIVGTVGGVTALHPTAKMCLRMMGITSANQLSRVIAAVGLVQNLGALKALCTEGIIQGHMKLHIDNLILVTGATESEIPTLRDDLQQWLTINKRVSQDNAFYLLSKIRQKWQIPAKTFLIGEYSALAENSAIVLTTTPYFELSLTQQEELSGIHEQSPAGLYWNQQRHTKNGLSWSDPYHGQGGLGASSAQFLACYLASCHLKEETPTLSNMLKAYYQCCWSGEGLKPSGYDVIAQSQKACVFINKQKKIIQSYTWPFTNLSFVLIRTGEKLKTHSHLQQTQLPNQIEILSAMVDEAKFAFDNADSELLITLINAYHQKLAELNLVAPHTLELLKKLTKYPEILAAKGCGAMGADIILLLCKSKNKPALIKKLASHNLLIVATEENLTCESIHTWLDSKL